MMNSEVANELMLSALTQAQRDSITSSEIPIKEITYHLLLNKKRASSYSSSIFSITAWRLKEERSTLFLKAVAFF